MQADRLPPTGIACWSQPPPQTNRPLRNAGLQGGRVGICLSVIVFLQLWVSNLLAMASTIYISEVVAGSWKRLLHDLSDPHEPRLPGGLCTEGCAQHRRGRNGDRGHLAWAKMDGGQGFLHAVSSTCY